MLVITDQAGANGILLREYLHLHNHSDAATTEDVVRILRAGDESTVGGENALVTGVDVVAAVSPGASTPRAVGRVHLRGIRGTWWLEHTELGDLAPVHSSPTTRRSVQ
jgi:hypothetical protein